MLKLTAAGPRAASADSTLRTAFEYWAAGHGLGNITPAGKAWPEGEQFPDVLREIVGERSVLEFGCGLGRLARLFAADRYVGVDICAEAIRRARANAAGYDFHELDQQAELPAAGVTLAHTVLLHVPDEYLDLTVGRFRSKIIVVSEILGRDWRRDGDPPVFNRALVEYESALAVFGYRLAHRRELPYPHYRDTNLTLMTFEK